MGMRLSAITAPRREILPHPVEWGEDEVEDEEEDEEEEGDEEEEEGGYFQRIRRAAGKWRR